MLSLKSHIFVDIANRKDQELFYVLTKTTAIGAGDLGSPAFFFVFPKNERPY